MHWGYGHASRCVPIIKTLISNGAEPVVAADREIRSYLSAEFRDLESAEIPSWPVTYPDKGPFYLHFLKSLKSFQKFIKKETSLLDELINDLHIDAVISDNRYGMYSDKVPSIFITHQLNIPAGFLSVPVNAYAHHFIKKFTKCWVPDFQNEHALAGKLSQNNGRLKNLEYIGPISRFEAIGENEVKDIDILAVISGPEPHRTNFEALLLSQMNEISGKHVLVRGNDSKLKSNVKNHIRIVNHADSKLLNQLYSHSKFVVCRSGYSSIMDLTALGIKALLIPTPYQKEQEYLAHYHSDNNAFLIQAQETMNLNQGLEQLAKKSASAQETTVENKKKGNSHSLLNSSIKKFLDSVA